MATPYSLGRLPNPPDPKDWGADKIHAHLAAASLDDPRLDQTVRQVAAGLSAWKAVLAFASWLWSWIKHHPAPPPPPVPTFHLWADTVVLDQGSFGTCVGNAGAGWMASEPVVDPSVNETLARALYYEATCYDGTCDSTYEVGTTSRSLAKALKARNRISAYAFAASMADIDEWLDAHGVVLIGSDWDNSMFTPDASGFVHPDGNAAGGHEYVVRGRESADVYRLRNSWGPKWGLAGDFRLSRTDLASLVFGRGGDALLCAELPL